VLALARHGAGEPRDVSASSGREGTFEFRGLAPGAYDLHGRTDDGRVGFLENVVVGLGSSPAVTVLTLAPGAKLRVEHRGGAAAGRFVVLRGGRIVASGSTRAGASTLVTVPAGPLTVRFTPEGGVAEERAIEAPAGAGETEVVFPSP
jgi:hypothetical protein